MTRADRTPWPTADNGAALYPYMCGEPDCIQNDNRLFTVKEIRHHLLTMDQIRQHRADFHPATG